MSKLAPNYTVNSAHLQNYDLMSSVGFRGENKKDAGKPKGDGALDTVYGGGFNIDTPRKSPNK